MIPLHRPVYEKGEQEYFSSARVLKTGQASFCDLTTDWLTAYTGRNTIMTNSCSTALDMTAELLCAKSGMEVIMPSFTFPSTANAYVKKGLVPVFVDIRKDTMNLDENKIEAAISNKTVAIVPMHYAGIACEMDSIMEIAKIHKLTVIEDAAQALGAEYKGQRLGTIGDFGCVSFHETKNFSMGEGGALFIREKECYNKAVIFGECGTNRRQMNKGEAKEYSWIEKGISCLPSELACQFLYPQLLQADEIISNRLETWNFYKECLKEYEEKEWLQTPKVPFGCKHNAHIFYIRLNDRAERDELLHYLHGKGIMAAFHYLPLHSSQAGRKYGRFHGEDEVTTLASECIVRLPLYYGMEQTAKICVIEAVDDWLRKSRKAGR